MSNIRAAEQEIRATEARYKGTIQSLRPKSSNFVRPKNVVLGNIDGVPVIEVNAEEQPDLSYEISQTASHGNREYALATSVLPWHTYSTMFRTIRLANEGIPHVFGVVEDGEYLPTEIGIYVPKENLVTARKRHSGEVLKDYPTVSVGLDDIRKLNLSSDFIYCIESKMALTGIEGLSLVRPVRVEPTADGKGYTYGLNRGFPEEVTELHVERLKATEINLSDFFEGKRHPLLENIRQAVGASCYQWTEGDLKSSLDYLFRFDKVLTAEEIADVLQKLGEPKNGLFQVTLHRLNDKLRSLVNLPLAKARPSSLVRYYVKEDFQSGQRPDNWDYLSISIF